MGFFFLAMNILALGEPEATLTPTRKVRTTQRAEAFGCKKNPLGDLVVLAAGVLVWAVSADLASEYSVALSKSGVLQTELLVRALRKSLAATSLNVMNVT